MLLLSFAVLLLMCQGITCLTHTRTLMWTEKSVWDGSVEVQGVVGDPEDWVYNGIREYARSYFADPVSRAISRRVALAFQYSSHRLFFSDKGFKEIFRITLQVAPYTPYTYNVSLEVVYGGISTQVNGMSMDWASGSLYWTDALYNWITVANSSDYLVYKHIIYTGFSKPMGIVVYPQKGLLFWSIIGAVPKIQRSNLAGENITNLIDQNIDRPLGLAIDYDTDHLYWVDDLRDTVERVHLDNLQDRWTITVGQRHSPTGKLFALALYNDFIFVTDQLQMAIQIFNKTTGSFIKNISATVLEYLPPGIPYDILMYDSSLQDDIDSDCQRLGCSDICISDGGSKAHCICQEGYYLSPVDHRTCYQNATFRMPQYIYSVGQTLCGTDVITADQQFVPYSVNCFYNISGHDIVALGFNAYASYLFFSDSKDKVIHRMLLTNDINAISIDVISANTGLVSGISVDWIADNIYWTDEDRGVIMVSRITGRYPLVLIENIDRPVSIAVNPLDRIMFWATKDTIFVADMNGQNKRILIQIPGSSFDGMVLDITRDLLYWVDQSLPGIRSCHMNGSGLAVVLQADRNTPSVRSFTDVTVFQNYIAWTDGMNAVYFGVTDFDNSSLVNILRGLQHVEEKASHDIITYDYYLQPLPGGPDQLNPCDVDNDKAGCHQLCLVTPTGHQCRCSAGFRLQDDGVSCSSDMLTDNFLLFVDPDQKAAFQFDLDEASKDQPDETRLRGIDLRSSNLPSLVAFDLKEQLLYWFDKDIIKNSMKQISIDEIFHYHTVSTLPKDIQVERIDVVSATGQLLYTDSSSGSVFLETTSTGKVDVISAISRVYGPAVALDDATGYLYWVNNYDGGTVINNIIYSCNLTSGCSNSSIYFQQWTSRTVQGLTISLGKRKELILWTFDGVYEIRNGSQVRLFALESSTSFNAVAMLGDVIYYVTSTDNAIFEYDTETKITRRTTTTNFSLITDLKIYCSNCYNNTVLPTVPFPPPSSPVPFSSLSSPGLGPGPIAGIVIGCIFFLLLLLLLLLIIVLLWRRREKEPTSPTVAYTNDAYDRLSTVVASLSGMPQGAHGLTAYDYYDDKKAVPGSDSKGLPFLEIFADQPPPLYTSDQAEGGGLDYFAKDEKHGLPFPEVSVVDLPHFDKDSKTTQSQSELPSISYPQEIDASPPEEVTIDELPTFTHI